eukprot:TRINITY_DN4530_c0_g1_i1.p1 TRINITY_DN4530_c0_g1~~TRINITY_DN4530_c0_g1_i1.p1  ORF type:complete len:553 (+),score=106.78 TRINITY_DN4530_c0_g1_i1:212-1870(+)
MDDVFVFHGLYSAFSFFLEERGKRYLLQFYTKGRFVIDFDLEGCDEGSDVYRMYHEFWVMLEKDHGLGREDFGDYIKEIKSVLENFFQEFISKTSSVTHGVVAPDPRIEYLTHHFLNLKVGFRGEIITLGFEDCISVPLPSLIAVYDEKGEHIISGTKQDLLLKLIDIPVNVSYVTAFLMSYRYFMEPEELFFFLKEQWELTTAPSQKVLNYRKKNVAAIISSWLKIYYPDDVKNSSFQKEMMSLCETISAEEGFDKVGSIFERRKTPRRLFFDATDMKKVDKYATVRERRTWVDSKSSIYDVSPSELADQITLIDFEYYSSIHPLELTKNYWNSELKHEKSGNVLNMIEFTNHISMWVGTCILDCLTLEDSVRVAEYFIEVAKRLYKSKNFNGLRAVLIGFNMDCVYRLKRIWKRVSRKHSELLRQYNNIFSLENNNASVVYEQTRSPKIPFLGSFLQEITYADSMPNSYEGNEYLINFDKYDALCERITKLLNQQGETYEINPSSSVQSFIINAEVHSLQKLRQISRQRIKQKTHASDSNDTISISSTQL